MLSRTFLCLAPFLFAVSCTPQAPPAEDAAAETAVEHAWSSPSIDRSVTVRDGRTGESLSFSELLDALSGADVVFLGESHIDETTHRVEDAVYEGLLARREGRVVLAMEMFERDAQEHLDAYVAGEIDEPTFLSKVRPWTNYRSGYRRLIERARAAGGPVVASNFPLPLRRRMAMEGEKVLEGLDEETRAQAPREFHPNSEQYWRRVDNAIRGHVGMMPPQGGPDERLYATQSLWDNSMGESCADALERHPDHLVLHVNGGFHSEYWDGTVRQLQLRKPEAKVVTVSILPTPNPLVAGVGGAPWADYVVFADARANDFNEGTWSVNVARQHRYRLHVPKSASDEAPVPLLIWLSDDGLTGQDGVDLWRSRLGEHAAIAVLEAPYRETQEDLGEGGRWFWPDTFPQDIGAMGSAIDRTWGYLLRNYPIDPERVCLAGEGTGATVVAATALMTERMDIEAVALVPRRYAKIKDFPLPLPEFRGDDPAPDKSLRVVGLAADAEWWGVELAEYLGIGFECTFAMASDNPWKREPEAESALRTALGIEPRTIEETAERRYVLVDNDLPRARHWARLLGLKRAADEGVAVAVLDAPPNDDAATRITISVEPEGLGKSGALPRCPGPFGGTTLLVVPAGTEAEQLPAWIALEENDPLNAHSRFHRLRVATKEADRNVGAVLAKLESENRKNVLIVPAEFCADAPTMRALRRGAREFEDRMTLHWLPGLGGRAGSQ